MSHKILCAFDGTEHGKIAVVQAVELAKQSGAELTVLAINVARGGGRAPIIPDWTNKQALEIAGTAKSLAKETGIVVEKAVVADARDAASAIIRYAHENAFDHIVTGTGEKSRLSKLVLGSVSAEVAAKAHCPVTIAR